jgi:solute carrier family 25 phosphate transporter 23/24/25/41
MDKFAAGGAAGMVATSIVQPLDLVKTRMQLFAANGRAPSIMATANMVLKQEGFFAFYNGYARVHYVFVAFLASSSLKDSLQHY